MNEPDNQSNDAVNESLDQTLDHDDERLTELELEELMEALDTPGL